jgi:hypothetical protein
VRYDAGARVITIYVNGVQVLREGWLLVGQHTISLGTAGQAEAVFTSFGLWSGQS